MLLAMAVRFLKMILQPVLFFLAIMALLLVGSRDIRSSDTYGAPRPPIDRLATISLMNSGVIAPIPRGAGDGPEYNAFERDFTFCSRDRLVASILVAEQYARQNWRRNLELEVTQLLTRFGNRGLDWSLGVGQIRPSTATEELEYTASFLGHLSVDADLTWISDLRHGELLELVRDECANALLAWLIVFQQKEQHFFEQR